jgi:hypothetical protein
VALPLALQNGFDAESRKRLEPERLAVSSKAMIAGTSEPLAVHAPQTPRSTTSLAQIALTAGAAVSYAGIMTAVYYDAASGKAYTLEAG